MTFFYINNLLDIGVSVFLQSHQQLLAQRKVPFVIYSKTEVFFCFLFKGFIV